jgi:hypothetical protein
MLPGESHRLDNVARAFASDDHCRASFYHPVPNLSCTVVTVVVMGENLS